MANKISENYHKVYNLSKLKIKDINKLSNFLDQTKFVCNKDFKINYFQNNIELIITNKELSKIIKSFLKIK